MDILHVGKAIIQEVFRYNFAVDIGIAETLRSRCMYFTSALVIASRELETEQQIMDDVLLAIITPPTRRVWRSFKFAPFLGFFPVSKVGLPLMGDTAVQYTDCYLRF